MDRIPSPPADADQRVFVLLQGPHGPFFGELGALLKKAGATVWRVGFNAGDARFWPDRSSYIAFTGSPEAWAQDASRLLSRLRATDLVLYGDVRPQHATAIAAARAAGLTVHVFEEGYLRPSWVTYERGGANGNSQLMSISVSDMQSALNDYTPELASAPARWGEMRQHVWHGARYQFHVMTRNAAYVGFTPHRGLNVQQEFALYLRKILGLPAASLRRAIATRRIRRGGFPYHLFLLQLEHDSSFQAHSDYTGFADVLDETISAFARAAPTHHHLVFKAHPLEDGRARLRDVLSALGRRHGVANRVHYVAGGKLAPLLDQARTALTVNSTAAQQALWRGIPVKTLGRAVYAKPELVSDQPLTAFFTDPTPPDMRAYRDFRHFLLESSQVAGGFYSARGRQRLLREVIDLMLDPRDPYTTLSHGKPRRKQPLRAVS
jgi:capsular polysaccharide export protein